LAALGQKFDATKHDTDKQGGDYEELPAGIMQLEMEASDVVETGPEGARTGKGLKYTSSVIAPDEIKGRKFFGFINLENVNAQAQEIGQKEFACLCRAIGISEVEDSEDLHFHTYTVKLGLGRPSKKLNADGTPQYPARMEVKRYFYPDEGALPEPAIDEVQPAAKPVAANNNARPAANQNTQAAKPAAAGNRPWAKK
jgi:hypothetical protein